MDKGNIKIPSKNMKVLHMIAFVLLMVGGLNWGLMAFNYNLVTALLGSWPILVQLIYALVGLSAIFEIATHKGSCKMCV